MPGKLDDVGRQPLFVFAALQHLALRRDVDHVGCTLPAQFVEVLRLDAARTLLARNLSIKAIAAAVGLHPKRLNAALERFRRLLNRNLAFVMVGLVPTIQPSACSVVYREVDPRDKPEDDSDGVWIAGSVSVGNALERRFGISPRLFRDVHATS